VRNISIPPPLFGMSCVVLFLCVVELLLDAGFLNKFVIPYPSAVLGSFWRLFEEEELLHRLLVTAAEALTASLLVITVGVSAGIFLHRQRILRLSTEPWIAAVAAAPIVLAYPLFLVIFGRSSATIIAMAFVAGLSPVVLKTIEGFQGVKRSFLNVGRSYNLSSAQILWKIQFPAAIPTIFTGIRLGLIFTLINLIGVEFLINFGGLGQLINDLAERYDLPGVFATIIFVVLVSVVIFLVLERLEHWFRPAR